MSLQDLLLLPVGVIALFGVMVWPAVWAVALMIGAFLGDIERHRQKRRPPVYRPAREIVENVSLSEGTRDGQLKT